MLSVHTFFSGGHQFGVPFRTLLHVTEFAVLNPRRTIWNVVSLVAVAAGLADALRHREFDLAVWAGAFLVLAVFLDGFWAFWDIDRYLLPALPVALLAFARLRLSRRVVVATLAVLLIISLEDIPRDARASVALQDGMPPLAWHISRVARTLHGGDPIGFSRWRSRSKDEP
jgi:hypothetical protein